MANNNKFVIFLDMDGVIADLEKHAHATGKFKEDGQLDNKALDYEWWSTMPAYEGARAFYKELKKYAEVNFLTAPMLSSGSYGGKAEWVERFINKWALMDLIECPSKKKRFLAGPGRILIDDREKNIKDWKKAGGIGILHEGDFQKTLAKLEAVINDLNSKPFNPKPKP